jgi:nucleoside transporter
MVRLWVMFFLLGMSPGFYVPALTNILTERGFDGFWVQWAWLAGPVAALLSPVSVGALADNRFDAEKLFGWIGLLSAALLAAAFRVLEVGGEPWWFIGLMFGSSLVAAPMWSLFSTIAMTHLSAGEREFPLVRLGGTLGWMAAGFLTSMVLNADASPNAGYAAAITRFAGGLFALTLPVTPPIGSSKSLRTLLGFDAFRLLRERDHAVFFATTALLSMPLVAFYMWTPAHLREAGDPHASATMAMGQVSEIAAMLLMVALLGRFRVKTLLLVALGLSAVRYGLFAWSGATGIKLGLWVGVALHGLCYTLYFITAQLFLDRRVPAAMRSQAQGLLSLFSNGAGSLLGTILVRVLHDEVVVADRGGWEVFWILLGGMIALLTLGFALAYRGSGTTGSSVTSR